MLFFSEGLAVLAEGIGLMGDVQFGCLAAAGHMWEGLSSLEFFL